MIVQHSSKTDRHFTPQWIIDEVYRVLGQVDLDPASEPLANQRIKASRIFTREDNGLNPELDWGMPDKPTRIFLNPPGGKLRNKSTQFLFWDRLVNEYNAGNVSEAIFLTFNLSILRTSQQSRRPFLATPYVLFAKRVSYENENGYQISSPPGDSAVAYFGGDVLKFYRHFGKYGYHPHNLLT